MILPIVAYGDPILTEVAKDIDKDYPNLKELIDNMFETMYQAPGVGLAAPQVGLSIRLIVIDASDFADEDESVNGFKKVFINAKMIEEEGEEWIFNEGCLSFPKLREDVERKPNIRIQYYDENFEFHDDRFDGIKARIIQHEYDHVEGILLVDRIDPFKKLLLKRKLSDISKGNVKIGYKIKYYKPKKKIIKDKTIK